VVRPDLDPPNLAGMNRTGLVALTGLVLAVPIIAVACGSSDDAASGTLPPIATTTTSTVLTTTTTTWVPVTYQIQAGDSLQKIADKFGVDIDKLAVLNGITNRDHINAGDVLDIPPPTVATTTVPPSST
jgi:LysM repeat protein